MKNIPFVLFFCLIRLAYSQSDEETITQNKIAKAESLYNSVIEDDSHLYNGYEYFEYSRNTQGHSFFLSDDWITGSVLYGNQWYHRASLHYDILQDKVVIEHPLRLTRIQLVDQNVKSFTLGDHQFIRIIKTPESDFQTGFYELLYNGKSQVIAKRKKTVLEKALSGEYRITLEESSRYYVLVNSTYIPIGSKSTLLKEVFASRQVELKQYIKKNKLKFRDSKESMIVKLAAYYDELNTK